MATWSSCRGPRSLAASESAVVPFTTPGSPSLNAWPARPRRLGPATACVRPDSAHFVACRAAFACARALSTELDHGRWHCLRDRKGLDSQDRRHDIERASNLVEAMVADDGETPNILPKRASILGLQAQYREASEILLRLNRDFPGRPAILRRLVVVFEQLRDIGKASAFLKAYGRDNPNDTWVFEKRERFEALGFR